MKNIVIAIAMIGLSGCATVVSGNRQLITIETPSAEGAFCEVLDNKGAIWYLPSTPGSLTVTSGDGPLAITCQKEGFEKAVHMIEAKMNKASVGNILLGGLLPYPLGGKVGSVMRSGYHGYSGAVAGMALDTKTGAGQRYPYHIKIRMRPKVWPSAQAKEDWENEIIREQRELEDAQKQCLFSNHKNCNYPSIVREVL